MRRGYLGLALICFNTVFLVPGLSAQETNSIEKLQPVPACADLVAFAATNQIPLDGFDSVSDTNRLGPGDSVTMLVTLSEKAQRRTQWLLELEVVEPLVAEQVTNPPPMTIYASDGSKFVFPSSLAYVRLRTVGPFAAAGRRNKWSIPEDNSARFALNEGFLGIGLDHTAVALMRLKQMGTNTTFWLGSRPPNAADRAKGQKLIADAKLTPEELRALSGSVPALGSYIAVVQQTKGLNSILFKIVDLPSVWSLIGHGGVTADISLERMGVMREEVVEPDRAPIYHLPLLLGLNGEKALRITLVATRPQSPLLACGGVVGLLAERIGDDETYLTLRVLSAKRGR